MRPARQRRNTRQTRQPRSWCVGDKQDPEAVVREVPKPRLVGGSSRADGRKELAVLGDGHRESAESWADLMREAKRRGMRAPVLAAGDGALGSEPWSALREVFLKTREQRCWFHKIGNGAGAVPKSTHPSAKKALAEIWGAEDRAHAEAAVQAS